MSSYWKNQYQNGGAGAVALSRSLRGGPELDAFGRFSPPPPESGTTQERPRPQFILDAESDAETLRLNAGQFTTALRDAGVFGEMVPKATDVYVAAAAGLYAARYAFKAVPSLREAK